MSNKEGYPDHTAEVAIFNVCREQKRKKEVRNGNKGRAKETAKGQKA